jgi:ribonuclease HI
MGALGRIGGVVVRAHSIRSDGRMKLTLFADGGSRGNPGPAASGAVLTNDDGAIVREIGTYLGNTTNNVAEWTGLITGLEAALELGATEIVVRLDSELVIKQLTGVYRVKHPNMIPLHAKAKTLLKKFSHVDIAHVPRLQNAAADAVVNAVLDDHAGRLPARP